MRRTRKSAESQPVADIVERPEAAQLQPPNVVVCSELPSFIRKFHPERVQNVQQVLQKDGHWEVTQKLTGASMTVYANNGEFGVCCGDKNVLWQAALRQEVRERMLDFGANIALHGVVIGTGIRDNPEQITGQRFYLIDIWSVYQQRFQPMKTRQAIADVLKVQCVPFIGLVTMNRFDDEDSIIEFANGASAISKETKREGAVFRHIYRDESFIISNKYLQKDEAQT